MDHKWIAIKKGRINLMIKALKEHPDSAFILKTLFYFIVLVALIYLYGYFGAGQAPFIYNEF